MRLGPRACRAELRRGEDRLVVLPRVHVGRHAPGHTHLAHELGTLLEELSHFLVAVQLRQLPEEGAREGKRVAAAVVVEAHRHRRVAAALY